MEIPQPRNLLIPLSGYCFSCRALQEQSRPSARRPIALPSTRRYNPGNVRHRKNSWGRYAGGALQNAMRYDDWPRSITKVGNFAARESCRSGNPHIGQDPSRAATLRSCNFVRRDCSRSCPSPGALSLPRRGVPALPICYRFNRKAGKKIRTIEKRTLELPQSYPWPGNIRELQNVIARSVVVGETDVFSVDPGWFALAGSTLGEEGRGKSSGRRSAAQERETIEAALAEAQGRISGPLGAATQLGMPPSTLESKIRALKIDKYRFKRA